MTTSRQLPRQLSLHDKQFSVTRIVHQRLQCRQPTFSIQPHSKPNTKLITGTDCKGYTRAASLKRSALRPRRVKWDTSCGQNSTKNLLSYHWIKRTGGLSSCMILKCLSEDSMKAYTNQRSIDLKKFFFFCDPALGVTGKPTGRSWVTGLWDSEIGYEISVSPREDIRSPNESSAVQSGLSSLMTSCFRSIIPSSVFVCTGT